MKLAASHLGLRRVGPAREMAKIGRDRAGSAG